MIINDDFSSVKLRSLELKIITAVTAYTYTVRDSTILKRRLECVFNVNNYRWVDVAILTLWLCLVEFVCDRIKWYFQELINGALLTMFVLK